MESYNKEKEYHKIFEEIIILIEERNAIDSKINALKDKLLEIKNELDDKIKNNH